LAGRHRLPHDGSGDVRVPFAVHEWSVSGEPKGYVRFVE
jgi:hypothetical protein